MANETMTLNDGAVMPTIGLGVWRTQADETAFVVRTAIDVGYRLVDTAAMYGNERGVGEAIRAAKISRTDVFVTTKLWNDRQGYDAALAAFDRSLQRLGLDYVDLYLIHWPSPARGLYVETWKALVRLKAEGRARSIGVSNFQEAHLKQVIDATGVTPSVNQIEVHPRFQQKRLREVHQSLGVVTQAWSPLGQGALLDDPQLARLAARLGRTPAQVVLRWHLANGMSAIPKSVTPARIRENFGPFDFALDEEAMATLDALDTPDGRMGAHPDTAAF